MASDLAKIALNLHNDIRAQHNAPPLEWSYELQRGAANHANALLIRKPGEPMVAASGVKYGQNLFELKTNAELTDKDLVERAVNSWYKEREDYNPNVQSGSSGLNFSQLVWKNTKKMGLAVARKETHDGMNKLVVTCFYDPSGNFRGEFGANVTSHKSSVTSTTRNSSSNPTWQDNSNSLNSSRSTKVTNNSITTNSSKPRTKTEWISTPVGNNGKESTTSTWRTTTTTTTTSRTSGNDFDTPNNTPYNNSTSTPSGGQSTTSHHVRFSSNNTNRNSSNSNHNPAAGIRTTTTTTTSSSTNRDSGTSGNGGNPQDVAVQLHNEYRRKHRAPSVKLDQKLCEDAQKYARSIVMGNNQTKENLGVGRNVYRLTTTGSKVDQGEAVKKAIEKWYSQAGEYNWSSPLASGFGANLFSQLIWKSSTSIGVGVATMGDMTAVCVLYSPPGNIASEQSYRENVQPSAY